MRSPAGGEKVAEVEQAYAFFLKKKPSPVDLVYHLLHLQKFYHILFLHLNYSLIKKPGHFIHPLKIK